MNEARRLLRADELKAVEIHHQMPGSVHACPPWIADRIAESRAREGELVAALEAMLEAAPQSIDNTAGHDLFIANNRARAALAQGEKE